MGQQDISDFLKKNKDKWFKVIDIARETGRPQQQIRATMKKLRKQNDIEFKVLDKKNTMTYHYLEN